MNDRKMDQYLGLTARFLAVAIVVGSGALISGCQKSNAAEPTKEQLLAVAAAADVSAAQLKEASALVEQGGEWTPELAARFRALMQVLTGPQRAELLRLFSSAINTKRILIRPGQNPLLLGLGSPGPNCPASNCERK
jgi:hypothetical protein